MLPYIEVWLRFLQFGSWRETFPLYTLADPRFAPEVAIAKILASPGTGTIISSSFYWYHVHSQKFGTQTPCMSGGLVLLFPNGCG